MSFHANEVNVGIRAAAEQLLSDIEAMKVGSSFGEFADWRTTFEGVLIEWPNLSISSELLRRALDRGD